MAMAERSQEHRQYLERTVVQSDVRMAHLGLASAFVLAAAGIGGGIYAMTIGHVVEGAGVITATLVSLTTTFVYGTNTRHKERETKAKLMAGVGNENG